jgi:hypothetical protein
MKIYGIYMVYKKRHFLRHLYMKMIIFPSQALDNDRQRHTLKTKALFFRAGERKGRRIDRLGAGVGVVRRHGPAGEKTAPFLRCHFIVKIHDHFTKTGSGQT